MSTSRWLSRARYLISVLLMLALPLLSLYPAEAQAVPSPDAAFSGLLSSADVSVTQPGNYNTEARSAFVAGGFTVHFPTDNFQLFNITPPSFNAGCSGISMFFGGFSFISGAQFSALVQNIMQAAIGYAIQLAIQTLCPACEAVLQVLQKAAQMANSLGNNTCRLAKSIVNEGASMLGISSSGDDVGKIAGSIENGAPNECAQDTASTGNGSGFLSSLNSGVCQFAASAVSGIENMLQQVPGAGSTEAQDRSKVFLGNTTYQALTKMGYTSNEDIEVLMTLLGTTIVGEPSGGSQDPTSPLPPLGVEWGKELKPLTFMYLCGTSQNAVSQYPAAYGFCLSYLTGMPGGGSGSWPAMNNYQVYVCNGTNGSLNLQSPDNACTNVISVPISEAMGGAGTQAAWSAASQDGFLALVESTLTTAVTDVANGTPLQQNAIQLIQNVPFPLYQVINLAAVYPDIAQNLISNASVSIGLMLTQHLIMTVLSNLSQGSTQAQHTVGFSNIIRTVEGIKVAQQAETADELRANDLELQMMHEVRQVNRLIQSQVMEEGLMGNQAYATDIMGNVTMGSPGSGE